VDENQLIVGRSLYFVIVLEWKIVENSGKYWNIFPANFLLAMSQKLNQHSF
jgi:hypothetical protein